MRHWKTAPVVFVCLILAAFAGGLSAIARPAIGITQQFSSEDIREANESIPMTLLGQFRTNLDAYLWLKTEDYLHGGITYRPFTEGEMASGMREVQADVGGFAQHSDGPTLIPPKEKDWRGIFGDLERNIQPYRPGPAQHGDAQELIPWYRIQTILNPLDVNAYVTCAFFLADFAKKPEEARAFLDEGVKNNPNSPEIHEAIGQLYFEKWHDCDTAVPFLEKAITLGKGIPNPDEKQETVLGNAYVFLTKAYRAKGDFEAELRAAEDGVAHCPQNALVRAAYRIAKKDVEGKNSPPAAQPD